MIPQKEFHNSCNSVTSRQVFSEELGYIYIRKKVYKNLSELKITEHTLLMYQSFLSLCILSSDYITLIQLEEYKLGQLKKQTTVPLSTHDSASKKHLCNLVTILQPFKTNAI